jgi:acetolactate synthase-1/2/3 large subunit
VQTERTGAHAVLEILERAGVEVVFGYPGGAIMPLHDALFGHRVRHVLVRHEAAAAFAAAGYARSSGRVGVCVATSGPGATNLVTGIADALLDNVPLVAITGQVESGLMGTDAFQEVDVAGVTHVLTKRSVVVRSVADLPAAIETALRMARGGRPGPVVVDIPSDVLKAEAPAPSLPPSPLSQPVANPAHIRAASDALLHAKRPLIIAGGGIRWADAVREFREFVALLDAPHAATLHGLGAAHRGDSAFLGMLGMHGWTRANRAVSEADAIVALGMRFDDRVTGDPRTFAPNAQMVIHADIDATEFHKIVPAQIALHGDLKATLTALCTELRLHPQRDLSGWRSYASSLGGPLPRDLSSDGHLSATDVLDTFFDLAPPDAIVTTDVGQHQMWAAQRTRPLDPFSFITSGGLGSMGFGFPAAIGAKFANPERPVVAIVGDGGFQMSFAELATLRRYNLPVKILLVDNRHLGMVRQWQQLFYEERYSATHLWDNPDFCALAGAYGITARSIDANSNLRDEIARFIAEPGAMLLHAACYTHENVFPMIPSGTSVEHVMEALPS